ncbi:MAG: TPM domain-containing protein [Candidatus Aminicenantes bacterium]|nr:TPM domain-containing protein [Candidatus Aminicenantes bacterium]
MKLLKSHHAILAGALLLLVLAIGVPAEVGTPVPPAPTRWLTDTAHFLSAATAAELDARLEAFEQSSGHQVVVYIAGTTGDIPIEDWAVRVFESWRVGRKGLDDGLALFVMAADKRVRIEVGYGLEGKVTDAMAGRIINDEMVPRLQKGDHDGAMKAAVERVIAVIAGDNAAGHAADGQDPEPKPAAKLTWMQKIIVAIAILGFLLLLITNPSLAIYLLFSILSGGRGGGGGGGFSGGGGRSGGGGASGSW